MPLLASTLAVCLLAATGELANAQVGAAFRNTIPTQSYYETIEELYRGEYRDAQRQFLYEVRGSTKIGVTARWIDAICYHTMLGETFYHQGLPVEALEQFNLACAMYLQYPDWLINVSFDAIRPDTNRLRRAIPWGQSGRQFTLGRFNTQMRYRMGQLGSTQQALRRGGVPLEPVIIQLDVVEVIRCTALAIRRRNELLGPLAPGDATTKALVSALSRGAAAPNHWSNAWVDLQLGLAYVGEGKINLALPRLVRAERVAGQFDHPLTCVSLLERGRLAMESGKYAEADGLLAEASCSAFYYEDPGTIDEAFRLMTLNRLASHQQTTNPKLDPAAAWARRERYDHIFSRLNLAFADELMQLENWEQAAAAIKTAQARLQDAVRGRLGNQAQYLSARGMIAAGNPKGFPLMERALEAEAAMSTRNFQIGLANRQLDTRQLRPRVASNVYTSLLSDPSPADWVFRPLETMAALRTPQGAAFDRWIAAEFSQKSPAKALEVTDLAKRRHYHALLPLAGRKAALASLLEAQPATLSQVQQTQRNNLLLLEPNYQAAWQRGQEVSEQIRAEWVAGMDAAAQRDLVRLWREWQATIEAREALLTKLALSRIPTTFEFPPQKIVDLVKSQLDNGQAILVFHESQEGMLGFLVTSQGSTHWNCGSPAKLSRLLTQFLRDIGNYDAAHDMTAEELAAKDWLESGVTLFEALLADSSIDVDSLGELIIVPDGLLWYVPFGALPVKAENEGEVIPWNVKTKMRVVPTFGLAVGNTGQWRRVQHSAVVGTELVPGDKDEEKQESLKQLIAALEKPAEIPNPVPVASNIFGAALETVVVMDEQELDPAAPLEWQPLPTGRSSKEGGLDPWLGLPRSGPQRLIYPGLRTIAENGGKPTRRSRGGTPGTELFLASCGLLGSGAETIMMSRWQVGGPSTLELTSEFVQELPYTSAADAWQRAVQLAREMPIEPNLEPRVKAGKDDPPLTASHPIFWSGYLLVDTGLPSPEEANASPPAGEKNKAKQIE